MHMCQRAELEHTAPAAPRVFVVCVSPSEAIGRSATDLQEGGNTEWAGALSLACAELPLPAAPGSDLVIPPKLQVIETRKKEAPYMLPEDVFVEKPR